MSGSETWEPESVIELEYELDAPPGKVWRAVTIPELLQRWLPDAAGAEPDAGSVIPGEEVRYRLREATPPFLESVVTLRIAPNESGGTTLRILHDLTDARLRPIRPAANGNGPPLMRAA